MFFWGEINRAHQDHLSMIRHDQDTVSCHICKWNEWLTLSIMLPTIQCCNKEDHTLPFHSLVDKEDLFQSYAGTKAFLTKAHMAT